MDDILKTKHIYISLLERIQNGESCVVATVTGTTGSTPQKPGSSAIIAKNGIVEGTVGGGVVEQKIESAGMEAVTTKRTGYFFYDLNNDISNEEAAICGGGMHIFLDAAPEKHIPVYESLKSAIFNRVPGVLITFCNVRSGNDCIIERLWLTKNNFADLDKKLSDEIAIVAEEMLISPNSNEFREIFLKKEEYEKQLVFLESIVPPARLIIAGAGHVGKALSHQGRLLGFEVTVWDERVEFANNNHLPDARHILSGSLDEKLGSIEVDQNTYIVIVTHGHKNDADVLRKFINSQAGYIGMMGSRKKIAKMRESFLEKGWATQEQWKKIYTPVGLEIHSKTVQEIVISIAAQLILVRNQPGR